MDTQALITFTQNALARVRELIEENGNLNLKLRIAISGGGCSGFQYGFSFDESPNTDDHCIDVGGVTCLVDNISFQYLAGATVDHEEKLEGSRFVISNPNAKSTCGCGSSFTV